MGNAAPDLLASAVADIHTHAHVTEVLDAAVRAAVERVHGIRRAEILTSTSDESSSAGQSSRGTLASGESVGFPIEERGRQVTSLVVYPAESAVLADHALASSALIARHTALALTHARTFENLQAALESRTAIGVAIGLLMERLRLDEDAAFAYLTRLAETGERKVREVAAGLVSEHLHSLPARPRPGPTQR